jgi:hypothetical protein
MFRTAGAYTFQPIRKAVLHGTSNGKTAVGQFSVAAVSLLLRRSTECQTHKYLLLSAQRDTKQKLHAHSYVTVM